MEVQVGNFFEWCFNGQAIVFGKIFPPNLVEKKKPRGFHHVKTICLEFQAVEEARGSGGVASK